MCVNWVDYATSSCYLRAAFDLTAEPVLVLQCPQLQVIDVNRAACSFWRTSRNELIGTPWSTLARVAGQDRQRRRARPPVGCKRMPVDGLWWLKNGSNEGLKQVEFAPVRQDGAYVVVAVVREDTEIRPLPSAGYREAYHDALTGLPNRRQLEIRLTQFANRVIERNEHFGLMFIDVNGFKEINDSMGHVAGDELLSAFAKRLEHCVRPADVVARFGGDEFVVLVENVGSRLAVVPIARRIRRAMKEPFWTQQRAMAVTASVGIACSADWGTDPHEMIYRADRAMYRAKARNRSRTS